MKRLIVILLIISMLAVFVSCSKSAESTEVPSASPVPTYEQTDLPLYVSDLDDSTINIYRLQEERYQDDEMDIKAWELYMAEKYGLDIGYKYLNRLNPDSAQGKGWLFADVGIDTDELDSMEQLDGFVIYRSIYDLVQLVDGGYVIPVNDFIDDMPALSVIAEERLMGFSDPDGNIWAIPTSTRMQIPRRVYNKAWLEGYGGPMPSTPEEFREYARYVAFGDPDGNGEDDTYIAAFGFYDLLSVFRDIFTAYGCYSDGYFPVAYDPNTGEFSSPMENGTFLEAMMFIKEMYDEGLIVFDYGWRTDIYDSDYNYMLGSVVTTGWIPEYFEGFDIGIPIVGLKSDFLLEDTGDTMGLAVLRDTENVAQKFNKLAEAAGQSMDSYMDFLTGMEGRNWIGHEDYIDYLLQDKNGDPVFGTGINIDLMLDFDKRKIVIYNGYTERAGREELAMMVERAISEDNLSYLGGSVIYSEPVVPGSGKIYGIKMYSRDALILFTGDIFEKGMDVEKAIHRSNGILADAGVPEILDEINSR